MKRILILLTMTLIVLGMAVAEVSAISDAESAANDILNKNNTDSKVLVVYFSRTGENYNVGNVEVGNTAMVASYIKEYLKCDSFEIVPVDKYPDNYDECTKLASKEKELDSKRDMLLENSEKINSLTGEKEELKIKLSELEIQNNVLTQRVAESEKENAELTEKNKFIVIENAEKLNAIESEFAQSKLTAQKELKLYGYYVERGEITLAELTKQMEEIRQSIEKSEI